MSKKYLGLICLLYSGIFIYVVIFDKLKLFLAPAMQMYIILSIIPMILIGLVMLFNNNVHYKFKVSDLVLILPLVLLIFAGDGRLTSSFASNRATNSNIENKTKSDEKTEDKKDEENIELQKNEVEKNEVTKDITENYDFTNVDFEVVDASYSGLSNYITYASNATKFNSKTIRIRGFAIKEAIFLPDNYFAIGKYEISCCAADAEFIGFIAKYDNSKITADKWYEIEGILEKGKDKMGYDIMYIKVINIKEISPKGEELYVYPCYAYDDGLCSALSKYDLE